jgi:opacity protein-like surface antigen
MRRQYVLPAFLASCALSATIVPQAARAQFGGGGGSPHTIGIGFGGGAVIPTGNGTNVYKSGLQGEGYVLVNLIGIPLRFNLGYQRVSFKQQLLDSFGVPISTTLATGHNSTLAGVAGLQIPLLHTPIYPYITAGLGAFHMQTQLDSGSTTSGSSTTPKASTIKFGFDAGGGLGLRLGRVTAFAEGKVQNVYSDQGMIKSAKQIQAVPVSVGLLFYVL